PRPPRRSSPPASSRTPSSTTGPTRSRRPARFPTTARWATCSTCGSPASTEDGSRDAAEDRFPRRHNESDLPKRVTVTKAALFPASRAHIDRDRQDRALRQVEALTGLGAAVSSLEYLASSRDFDRGELLSWETARTRYRWMT